MVNAVRCEAQQLLDLVETFGSIHRSSRDDGIALWTLPYQSFISIKLGQRRPGRWHHVEYGC